MARCDELAQISEAILSQKVPASARARLMRALAYEYGADAVIDELVTTLAQWQEAYEARLGTSL